VRLPERATAKARETPDAKKLLAACEKLRAAFVEKGVDKALKEGVESNDPNLRLLSVIGLGAVDDLEGLGAALNDSKHADVRDNVIVVARQWIGRGPGQDAKLYQALLDKGITPVHAEIVMQLLHSFGEAQLGRPETYETLIAYLNHPRVGTRELARWHLYRLVPEGKKIKYDAAAPEAERKKAQDEWKKLIPDGTVPEKPKLKLEPKDKPKK
jgi:hypothetical protein